MNAEQALQAFWATKGQLTALIPADRIFTGLVPQNDELQTPIGFPRAQLEPGGESNVTRTSSGIMLAVESVKLTIYATSYDWARAAERIASQLLNRLSYSLPGFRILDVKPGNRLEVEDADDGIWSVAREYTVRTAEEMMVGA